jgi:hypothetical protein
MTIGTLRLDPGLPDAVPNVACFTIDIRDTDIEILKKLECQLLRLGSELEYLTKSVTELGN